MSATTPWQCGPETWDTALVSLLKSRRFSNVKSSVGSTSAPSRALKFQGCRSRCTLGRVRHSGLSVVASPEPTGTFTVGLYTHHLSWLTITSRKHAGVSSEGTQLCSEVDAVGES